MGLKGRSCATSSEGVFPKSWHVEWLSLEILNCWDVFYILEEGLIEAAFQIQC